MEDWGSGAMGLGIRNFWGLAVWRLSHFEFGLQGTRAGALGSITWVAVKELKLSCHNR